MVKDNFTNDVNIVYPTKDDLVEIEVLNNNTRLLERNKADINHIHNQYVTKSEFNNVTEDLTEIKNSLIKIQENSQNWHNLPNLNGKQIIRAISSNQGTDFLGVASVAGKGTLIYAIQQTDFDEGTTKAGIKIEIDEEIILNIAKEHTISESKYRYFNYLGLINTQNLEIVEQSNNEYLAQYNTTFVNIRNSSSGVKPLIEMSVSPYIERTFDFNRNVKSFIRETDVQRAIGVSSGKIINLAGIKFNKSFKISTYFNHNNTGGSRSERIQYIYSINN